MTSFIFRETAMIHLLLWGNSYSQILRDGMGRVIGLYPLLPNHMSVDRDERGEIVYTYTAATDENPTVKAGKQIQLRRQDILHIPGLGFDGLVGYSPIACFCASLFPCPVPFEWHWNECHIHSPEYGICRLSLYRRTPRP